MNEDLLILQERIKNTIHLGESRLYVAEISYVYNNSDEKETFFDTIKRMKGRHYV